MASHPYKIQIPPEEFEEEKADKKVFYQVLLRYNSDAPENADIAESAVSMESKPCATPDEAHTVLSTVIDDIVDRIKDIEVVKVPPNNQIDNYNILVIRKREDGKGEVFIIARLGIVRIDYTEEVLH